MNKPYDSFPELVLNCEANLDYNVTITDRGAAATIVSIHGGAIEPLTGELAAATAGAEYNLYSLNGLRAAGNRILRVSVSRFEDVRLFTLLKRSQVALSVDGVPGTEPVVHLGGANALMKQIINDRLTQSGFQVRPPYSPGAAHDPTRFYNAAIAGGVLLELSESLRAEMTTEPLSGSGWRQPSSWQDSFFHLAAAICSALQTYLCQSDSDLVSALARFETTTLQIPPVLLKRRYNIQ